MKVNNESGITLLLLVISMIIMLILAAVTIGSYNPGMYEMVNGISENAEAVRNEQDREAQNAIQGLGGMD